MDSEIIFVVEESDEGGFIAKALGESIFTEGDNMDDLKANIKDAVLCHYDEGKNPKIIRLHYIREEFITV
jgi:hypothetical protein